MKKVYLLFVSLIMVLISFSYSYAVSFTFDTTVDGVTASATMEINISDSTLTLTLENTSPTYDIAKPNVSAITGFGYNLSNDADVSIYSWVLTAYRSTGSTPVKIGDNTDTATYDRWDMTEDSDWKNLKNFNYLPHVEGGKDGALYNPDLKAIIGDTDGTGKRAPYNFFTTAILTMIYTGGTPELGDIVEIKMQRVGPNDVSVDLTGQEIPQTPEPGTMLLLGSLAAGLFGFAGLRKRF